MLKSLIKKSISLALAFAAVLSLSCCDVSEEEIILPDIVFVMYRHYPLEKEYLTGKFIGTAGYYIDKNGEIKYFEFEDEVKPIFKNEPITIEEYSDLRNIKEFHEHISEISIDTEFEPISKEDLINYYNSLLKINKSNKLSCGYSTVDVVFGLKCIYGIRTTDINENEYILIKEDGDKYYFNNNSRIEKFYRQLLSIFPEM